MTQPGDLTIISMPFSGGQGKAGVDEGPELLESRGLSREVAKLGWKVTTQQLTFEDVVPDPPHKNMKRPKYVSKATKQVYEAVSAAAQHGVVLNVGGDHSIGIGTIAGILKAHPDAVILWIDAHADLNTPAATESGNLHGCPLSFVGGIDGLAQDDPFEWVPRGCLDFSRLAYIGLRDVDDFEKSAIRKHNIAAYSMHDVDRHGIGKVVDMALERVNPGLKRPIHLSFDVDALDPFFAPATGTPVRGGLTWREGCFICERVAETGRLVGMDLVECNPLLGSDSKDVESTIQSGISLVRCALGQTLL